MRSDAAGPPSPFCQPQALASLSSRAVPPLRPAAPEKSAGPLKSMRSSTGEAVSDDARRQSSPISTAPARTTAACRSAEPAATGRLAIGDADQSRSAKSCLSSPIVEIDSRSHGMAGFVSLLRFRLTDSAASVETAVDAELSLIARHIPAPETRSAPGSVRHGGPPMWPGGGVVVPPL